MEIRISMDPRIRKDDNPGSPIRVIRSPFVNSCRVRDIRFLFVYWCRIPFDLFYIRCLLLHLVEKIERGVYNVG